MNERSSTTTEPDSARQPTLVQLAFGDAQALHAAYIPVFTEGGLFVATAQAHRLGDAFELVLTLPGDSARRTVTGQVAWITPLHAPGGRPQGVGVAFDGDAESRALKLHIESILGGNTGASARPTQVF